MQVWNISEDVSYQDHVFFYDANVWRILFGPPPGPEEDEWLRSRREKILKFHNGLIYFRTKTLLEAPVRFKKRGFIAVDACVIAETIKGYIQPVFDDCYKAYERECKASNSLPKSKNRYYKEDFRPNQFGSEYQDVMYKFNELIEIDVVRMVESYTPKRVPTLGELGILDLNDYIYVELCKGNDYTLVTDDGDVKNSSGIKILTSNPAILRAGSKSRP
ncbi:hypothetical protein WDZ92_01725 [Nostoc sp. NIES-2111]